MMPPWRRVAVVARRGGIVDGGELELRVDGRRWVARYRDVTAGQGFTDEQIAGPFRRWVHVHRMIDVAGGCRLDETVDWELPGGALGRVVAEAWTARQIARFFAFRTRRLAEDHARHAAVPRPLRVAVSGSGGLVGGALADFLDSGGHQVLRLVRRAAGGGDCAWDPTTGLAEPACLDGVDAVVHLAGRNLSQARWTAAERRALVASRVDATRRLCEQLAALPRPPRALVVASAVGYYGDRGDALVDEEAGPGSGFLADLCRAWEAAADPARAAGMRVVHARLGIVLAAAGGALRKLLPPFRLGLGGRLGHGRQAQPWIALDDAVYALHRLATDDRLTGAFNLVAPQRTDNRAVTAALARVLRRPAVLPAPAWALRLALGGFADEALLGGAHAVPARLQAAGFRFSQPDLEQALRWELGR